jgi:dTDP-glucose pyrophosphorylase
MSESQPQLRTAVILAAGRASASIAAVFGHTSPGLLPINGRPIIHWSVRYLQDAGIRRVIIGLRGDDLRLRRFVSQTLQPLLEIEFVPITEDRGPGFTLLRCIEKMRDEESCLVVLGDTLFGFPASYPLDESFVLTAPVDDAKRWCFASVADGGQVNGLVDKPAKKPGDLPALIGVYYLNEAGPAKRSLQTAADSGATSIQLSAALYPYIHKGSLRAIPAGQWFDCGNLDLLTSSRRRLLQSRSFNTMDVDELRGTVTKRSEHRLKFVNEINYYRLLPPDLAIFFPRTLSYSIAPDDTFVTLEYYGYGTLSELWVFEEFEASYWQGILGRLAQILDQFARYTIELSTSAVFQFYWTKTIDRLDAFVRQQPEFDGLVNAPELTINGVRCLGWPRIAEAAEAATRAMAGRARGQIIHGDLCFPNILYDPLNRVFKLVDPRGSFADAGIFGDARYDAAKLFHSVHGGYDFIVHDMFRLKRDAGSIGIEQFFPEVRPAVLAGFEQSFGARFDMREIRLVEALLFLSMTSLHADFPQRQLAMFAIGIKLLNESLNDENLP